MSDVDAARALAAYSHEPHAGGSCFTTAIEIATALVGAADDVLICHGTPIGRGEVNGGERFWHAWVEARGAGSVWLVIDGSVKPHVQMKRASYYRAGSIEFGDVYRFTPADALAEVEARGHAGPWVDNYDGIAL